MFNRFALGVFFALLWPVDVCLSQERTTLVLTLARCEELAFENNPRVKDADMKLEASRARRTQVSHARFLPVLTLSNVLGPIPRARAAFTDAGLLTSPDTSTGLGDLRLFTQVDLDLVQPILTFGKLSGLNDAAAFGVRAGEAQVIAQQDDVRLQVRRLYWGLVLGQELLQVVEDALTDATRADSILQQKFDEGSDDVTQNDLFKFQLFQYEIRKNHREALDKVALTKAALGAAIGLDGTIDFELATAHLDPVEVVLDSLPVYFDIATASRPELAQLRAGIQAQRSLVRVSRSDYLPQLFFGAKVQYNYAPDRFDPKNPFIYNPTNFFRPGLVLGFNWNLNFVQTRDRARLAEIQYSQLAQRETALVDGILLEVQEAYLQTRQAEQNTSESRTALRASDNWLRAESQTFDLGLSEVKDIIDAFRASGVMNAEHLRNIFDFNASLAALSKAIGRDLYLN